MIGQFIKTKRLGNKMSGRALASHISTQRGRTATPSWVTRLEKGQTDITLSQFTQLAAAFGTTPSRLFAEYEAWAGPGGGSMSQSS